jgi:1-deoxyxylulose-5-phosphate synthase
MEYVKLGSTGLDVSPLCVGCMTFGEPDRGPHPWTLPEAESRPLIKAAIEAGVNFFDTANVYSAGSSEEIVGRALAEYGNRDELVVATKVHGRVGTGPNRGGLSRKAILAECDASLRRLGMDYIDLHQIHRWDPTVPVEETLQALSDLVDAGKVRYLGASSMYAWQFSKALYLQQIHGWHPFVTMQDHYNLINREEEREMYPLCADQGVGVIPWSPLARGVLTRAWGESTSRSETDQFGKTLYEESTDRVIVDRVAEIATERNASRAQVALAWVLSNPVVTAPIVGLGKLSHLSDAVAALELELTADERERLEEPYVPHPIIGF